MIRLEDQAFSDDLQWYDIEVEIFPCRAHWNRGHRWFGEVSARISDFPEDGHGIWNHYFFFDFTAWTLRRAWFKGLKAINHTIRYIHDNPDDRPQRD